MALEMAACSVPIRYPTFQDALRDMDDALCMLFLYSALPSSERAPLKLILMARRLILEFQRYETNFVAAAVPVPVAARCCCCGRGRGGDTLP